MRQQQADQLLEDAYYSTIGFSRRKRLADTYSMLLASLGPSTMIHQSRTLPNPIPQVPFEDTLAAMILLSFISILAAMISRLYQYYTPSTSMTSLLSFVRIFQRNITLSNLLHFNPLAILLRH